MHTDTAQPAPNSVYSALLAEAHLAALRALTDILSTSDDPTEKRLAAAAILRAPEPKEPQTPCRPRMPTAPEDADAPPSSAFAAVPAPNFDPAKLERIAAQAREVLARAGIQVDDDLFDVDPLAGTALSPAARLIRTAGQALTAERSP